MKIVLHCGIEPGTSCITDMFIAHQLIVIWWFRIQGTALINLWYCPYIPYTTAFQSYK